MINCISFFFLLLMLPPIGFFFWYYLYVILFSKENFKEDYVKKLLNCVYVAIGFTLLGLMFDMLE